MAFNIVEWLTEDTEEDGGFNQACKFGHLVQDHSVYCHNDIWKDAPRGAHAE
jgi:hypothetical protein